MGGAVQALRDQYRSGHCATLAAALPLCARPWGTAWVTRTRAVCAASGCRSARAEQCAWRRRATRWRRTVRSRESCHGAMRSGVSFLSWLTER